MLNIAQNSANANGAYVYFMHHDSEDMIKIGKAIDCKKRWNLLGNTFDFSKSYIKKFPTERSALQYERSLHKLFSDKRLNLATNFDGCTEWFCSSIFPEIIEKVPDLISVTIEPEEAFKRKKLETHFLHDHWEFTLLNIMKELVSNCSVHVVEDHLVLNGDMVEKYANILFNHGVKTKGMYFRVFTSLKWEDDTCFVRTDMDVIKKVYPEIFN